MRHAKRGVAQTEGPAHFSGHWILQPRRFFSTRSFSRSSNSSICFRRDYFGVNIAPSRLVTPYVAGLFTKPGGQLYVNRGLGTIFIPMRVGAPPELTVYTLTRG